MSHLDVMSAVRIGCVQGNVCNICLVMGFQGLLPGDIETRTLIDQFACENDFEIPIHRIGIVPDILGTEVFRD